MYQKSLLKTVTSLKTTKKIFGKPKDVRGNGRRENAKRKESLKNVKKLVISISMNMNMNMNMT